MHDPVDQLADPVADIRQKPLIRPWFGGHAVPTLMYVDARGKMVALTLDAVGVAHLALSLAEEQARIARRNLAAAGTNGQAEDSQRIDPAA